MSYNSTEDTVEECAKRLFSIMSTSNIDIEKLPASIKLRMRLLNNLVRDGATYSVFKNEFQNRFGNKDGIDSSMLPTLLRRVEQVEAAATEKGKGVEEFADRKLRLKTIEQVVVKLGALDNQRDRMRALAKIIDSMGKNVFSKLIKVFFYNVLDNIVSARSELQKKEIMYDSEMFESIWKRSANAWMKENPAGAFHDFFDDVMAEFLQFSKLDVTRTKTEKEQRIDEIIKIVSSISEDDWDALLVSPDYRKVQFSTLTSYRNDLGSLKRYLSVESDFAVQRDLECAKKCVEIIKSWEDESSYDDEALDRVVEKLATVASNFKEMPPSTNYVLSMHLFAAAPAANLIKTYLINNTNKDIFRAKAHSLARGGGNLVVEAFGELAKYYEIEKKAQAALNNSTFNATWNSINDSVKKLNKYKWTEQVFLQYFAKIDPIAKVDYMASWFEVIGTIRSTPNPNDERIKLSAARLWVQSEDNEKAHLLQRINDGIDRYVEAVKVEREKLRKNSKPEASPDDEFEEYLFADERHSQVPDEPDTRDEKALYDKLEAHFVANEALSEDEANLIKRLMADGKYSTVLKKPDVELVYRGMAVNDDYLRRALGLDDDESLPQKGSKTASFTFTPRNGGSSSWSLRHESTFDFMNGSKDFNVLLIARTSDNDGSFVSGPGGLYKVGKLGKHEDEQEVVGLGAIKVAKIIWDERGEFPAVETQEST